MAPKLNIADLVRPHHGNTFAEEWAELSQDRGAIADAFEETHLIEWPYRDDRIEEAAAQSRYHEIADEIIRRVLEAVRQPIIDAFVRIASDVLARERER